MKALIVIALVGLVVSFAVPAVAQKKDAVDPQILEQLATLALELIYLVLTVW
jgi:hypothetical protein